MTLLVKAEYLPNDATMKDIRTNGNAKHAKIDYVERAGGILVAKSDGGLSLIVLVEQRNNGQCLLFALEGIQYFD